MSLAPVQLSLSVESISRGVGEAFLQLINYNKNDDVKL